MQWQFGKYSQSRPGNSRLVQFCWCLLIYIQGWIHILNFCWLLHIISTLVISIAALRTGTHVVNWTRIFCVMHYWQQWTGELANWRCQCVMRHPGWTHDRNGTVLFKGVQENEFRTGGQNFFSAFVQDPTSLHVIFWVMWLPNKVTMRHPGDYSSLCCPFTCSIYPIYSYKVFTLL